MTKITTVASKAFVAIVAAALVFTLVAPAAKAATDAALQAQITALLAQIAALSGTPAASTAAYTFTRSLTDGSTGADVTALQTYLISKGHAIAAGATGYFGAQTKAAVAAWQTANGIVPAVGFFGPLSQAKYTALMAAVVPVVVTPTTPDTTPTTPSTALQGGAGSIDSFDEISGIANEEVGENKKDVVVAGIEIENSDESDIMLTAVRLDFSIQPGNEDLDEFITEVAIMLDGKEVARVDADEFNDNNSWTRTVSLKSGAVILSGDTADLKVAVTGVNNVDSGDEGDDWGLDFVSVRYTDAQGAILTDDTSTNGFLFDVVSFAAATNIEFKISNGADAINKAHVINVDADDETDNVDLFSFKVQINGGSDVTLDGLQLTADMSGAGADILSEMFSSFTLEMDGDEVGTENAPAHATDLVFDDMDLELKAGKTYVFTLVGDILDLSGTLLDGDNVSWAFGETETDDADFDAEDQEGDALADSDVIGSASAEAHAVYDAGIMAKFVSATAVMNGGIAAVDDIGTFTIVFDVTAFDSDIYIDGTAIANEAGGATYQNIVADNIAATAVIDSNADDAANTTFKIDEGTTERFTLTISGAGDDVFANAALESILYALTAIDGDVVYNFNMAAYKTGNVFLSGND